MLSLGPPFATITRMTARSVACLASLSLLLLPSARLLAAPAAAAPTNPRIATLLDGLDKTKHAGPVSLSPDGHTIAMVLAGTLTLERLGAAGATGTTQTPTVCSSAKNAASINSLAWSPDSAHLGILAECGDTHAVSLLDVDAQGHAAKQAHHLAALHGFAEALSYAPDGKHLSLLYVEGASRPSGALAAMKPPSGVIGVEGLEIQRVATVDATTGTLSQVTPPALHVYEFAWSPDASKLAFVAAPAPGENNWWVAKLYTQPATPGAGTAEPKVILDPGTVEGPLHGLQIAVPRWSPDASQIAFIGGLMSDQGATGGDLYTVAADGSTPPADTTPGTHVSFQWIDWLPSGTMLATAIDAGEEEIDTVSIPALGSETTKATHHEIQTVPYTVGDGRLQGSFAVSRDGSVAAWAASSYTSAPEVYAGALTKQPMPVLTHLNDALKPSWGKTESIHWTNGGFPGEPADAQHKVQGWLFYPANYDPAKKYPLIVMVHGGPSSAVTPRWPYAGFGAAPFSAMGYFVLEPNPRGSYGEGEAFTQANRKDFGYGDLRDILAGVDAVEKQIPSVDDSRLGITGWSYGGFMTMFDITQTHRFKAAVAGAGISDWLSYYGENSIDQWMLPFFGASVYDDPAVYAKSSAINYIKQVKTPTLVVVGDRDGECPAPQSFEFWHALKAEGVDTQLVVYPNEGHGFVSPEHRRDVISRAVNWFDTHLE